MFDVSVFRDLLLMLVILNPFAQMLYLGKLMEDSKPREFASIYIQGTLLTFAVCLFVALTGEFLLFTVFQITLASLRIFGGLINLQLSYNYVMKGPEGIKLFSGDANQLAQQIALPIMVGAGVVWVSMRIGVMHPPMTIVLIIGSVLTINALCVLCYQMLIHAATGRVGIALKKWFGIAMRFNAMLIGAVSVEMIIGGIVEFISESAAATS